MAKKLKLTFAMDGDVTMDVTVANPKDGLALAAVQNAAADLMPVLEGKGGIGAKSLKEAKYITTTEEAIA